MVKRYAGAKPGPPRTATEDLKRRGSTKAIGRTISAKAEGIPQPSEYLQGEARAIWFQMIADLKLRGHLSPSYANALEIFCGLMAEYRGLTQAINETGVTSPRYVKDDCGEEQLAGYAANKLLGRRLEVASALLRYGDRFGWTPASNQTLSDAKAARDDEKEAKFFGAVG